ncbi:MAG: HAD-IIB family hydrolase [Blastochloris sp.]|nr:HAD-IIB family hydrolase [Blastochloris sp.]
MMEPLLLSTDFDGTLLDHSLPGPLAPDFFDWLETTRQQRRVIWIINTGRDWASLDYELTKRQARCLPDWVVLVEREIHQLEDGTKKSLACWNDRCQSVHDDLFLRAAHHIEQTRQDLTRFPNLQIITDVGSPLGLIAESEAQAHEVQAALQPLLDAFPEMHSVRNSIYFRFAHIDYHKGSCLDRIGQHEAIPPERRFAAGDHLNDLPMLHRHLAQHLTCPSNSVAEVKNQVLRQNGHVSELSTYLGIVEGLKLHFPA